MQLNSLHLNYVNSEMQARRNHPAVLKIAKRDTLRPLSKILNLHGSRNWDKWRFRGIADGEAVSQRQQKQVLLPVIIGRAEVTSHIGDRINKAAQVEWGKALFNFAKPLGVMMMVGVKERG